MMAIGRCSTGEVAITPGFNLSAQHVIHTVAPVFSQHTEADVWRLLANCYSNSLALAVEHGVTAIAFPSLGTGAYGVPIESASVVAVESVRAHAESFGAPAEVVFCCFSSSDAAHCRAALAAGDGA